MMDCKILCLTCVHGGMKNLITKPIPDSQTYVQGVRCRIDGEPLQDRNLRTKCNQYKLDESAAAPTTPAPAKVTKDAATGTKEVILVTYDDIKDIVLRVVKDTGSITIVNGGKAE